MVDNDHSVDRRTVLRTIVAGGTVAAGSGLAVGRSTGGPGKAALLDAQEAFGDLVTVERVFEARGRSLEETLLDGGYLSPGGTASVDSVVSLPEYENDDASGVATVGVRRSGGSDVVDVRVRQHAGEDVIEYHLSPDGGTDYAVVRPADGDAGVAVLADGTEEEVSTTSCCPDEGCINCGDYFCSDDACGCDNGYRYFYEYVFCCDYVDGSCECNYELYCRCLQESLNC